MTSLGAWFLFPLVAYALTAGLSLLAGALVRATVPGPLLAPVGAFLAILVSLPVYKLGGNQVVAAVILVVLGVAGHVVAHRGWWSRVAPGWPLAAGVAAYGLYIAPVVLSGHWRWLGYNFVNDTAVNMVLIDHIAHHGVRLATGPPSTTQSIINGTLGAQYPMGVHSLVATLRAVVGFLPLAAVYQPFIAFMAGLAAMALAWLAGRAGARGPLAALVGTVAAGGNLAYWYASHGAFKELAMVTMVATAAALSALIAGERLRVGWAAQLGALFAASVALFSTAALGYVGVFAVVLLVALLAAAPVRPRVPRLAIAAAAGVVAMVVTGFSGLQDAISYGRGASNYYEAAGGLSGPNSTAFLGHLLRPLPFSESSGVWLGADYRVPPAGLGATLSAVAAVLVAVLVLVAVVVELRRRRPVALLAVIAPVVVYLVGDSRLGPYAEAKLLVILTPAVVFAALIGALWIGRRVPVLGALLGVALAGGVLVSDAFAYHAARLAPLDRLEALDAAAAHAPRRDLVLMPEWEEWAKFFTGARRVNVSPESFSPRPVELRTYFPYFAHSLDLDLMTLPYVDSFRAIVLRRGPDVSRPPADYRLAYENRWYALWLKASHGPRVLDHLPLQGDHQAAALPDCSDVRAMLRRASPGQAVVGARRDPVPLFDYTDVPPAGWNPGPAPGTVVPGAPNDAATRMWLAAGRYRVWMRGSSGRALHVYVDGRQVGTAVGVNTPDTWLPAGRVSIRRSAMHDVRLFRPGGSLYPGDGFPGELGPLAFQPVGPQSGLVRLRRGDVQRACGETWDWIERVRR